MKASRDFRLPGALAVTLRHCFALLASFKLKIQEIDFLPHSKAINEEKIRIEIFSCFNRNFKVIGEEIIRSEVFSLL